MKRNDIYSKFIGMSPYVTPSNLQIQSKLQVIAWMMPLSKQPAQKDINERLFAEIIIYIL